MNYHITFPNIYILKIIVIISRDLLTFLGYFRLYVIFPDATDRLVNLRAYDSMLGNATSCGSLRNSSLFIISSIFLRQEFSKRDC